MDFSITFGYDLTKYDIVFPPIHFVMETLVHMTRK